MSPSTFRLEALPPELLRHVCEYALPQGLTFSFSQLSHDHRRRRVFAAYGNHKPYPIVKPLPGVTVQQCKIFDRLCRHNGDIRDEWHTGLLYVNEAIASEARGKWLCHAEQMANISSADYDCSRLFRRKQSCNLNRCIRPRASLPQIPADFRPIGFAPAPTSPSGPKGHRAHCRHKREF